MNQVQRICPQCQQGGAVDARYCPHCRYDHQSALPAPRSMLPVAIGRMALPVLVGVATFALRAGWQLLNARTAHQPPASNPQPAEPRTSSQTPRHTIRIRTVWAVGDSQGRWQQGATEQTIELD